MINTSEFTHGAGSTLDYGFNWSEWLQSGETITVSVWAPATDLIFTNAAVTGTGTITSVFVAGGEAGKTYKLYNTVTTSAGRIDSRTLTLSCKKR